MMDYLKFYGGWALLFLGAALSIAAQVYYHQVGDFFGSVGISAIAAGMILLGWRALN